jgi:hypothetical protein
MKFDDEVKKQLDAVVGESYQPPRRWRATVMKWLAAAVLAVATSALIIGILHTHVMQAQNGARAADAKKAQKAVPVFVIPGRTRRNRAGVAGSLPHEHPHPLPDLPAQLAQGDVVERKLEDDVREAQGEQHGEAVGVVVEVEAVAATLVAATSANRPGDMAFQRITLALMNQLTGSGTYRRRQGGRPGARRA